MAASDGTVQSRHLGTDQANRRVIARDAIWPEHLAPETVRWLRRGLLADEPGAVRRYHDGDGVTRAAQGAWLSARVPAQTWDGPLQLDADDDEVLRRQWADAATLPVDGYYDVHVQVPVDTPGEHTIEARVARGQTISETVWAAGTLAGVVPLGPAQAGDSWELRCDGLPIAEGTLTIQLVHRLDGGGSPRFWTDFSEYEVGETPDDWTSLVDRGLDEVDWLVVDDDTGDGTGGVILRYEQGFSDDADALGWLALGDVGNGEALARVTITDTTGTFYVGIAARIVEGQEAWLAQIYFNNSGDTLYLTRYVEGDDDSDVVATQPLDDPASGEWWWVRLRMDGDRLRVRAWQDGDDEPDEWQIDHVDDRIPESGALGVAGWFDPGTGVQRNVDVFGFAPVGRAPMSLE